jgi:hypothetical protein
MSAQSWRVGRAFATVALSFSMIAGPAMIAAPATAQQTAIVDPNAPKGPLSAHDAAIDAARRGDYIAAVDFAKKAAAAGQPLEADQVDFMQGKAAKQQAALDEETKAKAAQASAQQTAEQIQARKQADYAKRGGGKPDGVAVAQCRAGDNNQVQTVTNAYASGFSRSGAAGPVTAEGGRKTKCEG